MSRLEKEIPAQAEAISALTAEMSDWLETEGVDARSVHHVALALDEILTNAVDHGQARQPLRASVTVAPDEVTAEICDDGQAFDPRLATAGELPRDTPLDRPAGGLGLLLVRRFACRLDYTRKDGRNYTTFAVARLEG